METVNNIELSKLCDDRASMYNFLSEFYMKEADEHFIRTLTSVIEKAAEHDIFSKEYAVLKDFINSGIENFYDELAADYAKIFLGIGQKQSEAAFPYESVYTSHKGLLMQEAWEQVCDIYAENGFEKRQDLNVPEDHIFIELQFMAQMARKSSALFLENANDNAIQSLHVQLSFIKSHFNKWVDRFCDEIKDTAAYNYYKAVADITLKFIKLDEETVDSIIESQK